MSRGPGRWQRAVLDAIEDDRYDIFPVSVIAEHYLRREPTHAELVAARRAVKILAIGGKVRAIYYPYPSADGRENMEHLCVTRPHSPILGWCARSDAPEWVEPPAAAVARYVPLSDERRDIMAMAAVSDAEFAEIMAEIRAEAQAQEDDVKAEVILSRQSIARRCRERAGLSED